MICCLEFPCQICQKWICNMPPRPCPGSLRPTDWYPSKSTVHESLYIYRAKPHASYTEPPKTWPLQMFFFFFFRPVFLLVTVGLLATHNDMFQICNIFLVCFFEGTIFTCKYITLKRIHYKPWPLLKRQQRENHKHVQNEEQRTTSPQTSSLMRLIVQNSPDDPIPLL